MGSQDEFLVSARQRQKQVEITKGILSCADGLRLNGVCTIDADHALRRLLPSEIETLESKCRCSNKNWSEMALLLGPPSEATKDQSQRLRELVSNTNFEGKVILCFSGKEPISDMGHPWNKVPIGIHNNLLIGSNSIVSMQSWTSRNILVCGTHVLPYSVLVGCGSVTASEKLMENDGQLSLTVGPESGGGRDLIVHTESDMIGVCHQLTGKVTDKNPGKNVSLEMNIVSQGCIVRDTPTIAGVFLSPGSSIQAATSVTNAILLPRASIRNGCTVDDVRLQWNSSIVDASRVSGTLIMEESQIGPNSLVASSILGPDVHVSAGEVHCSILGPNTNSHHQSLVISVLWPCGRGNVGYGSNIGSNHTGRIPDQETTSGEGVFWGLSCVIKFPVDLTMAPYSIVAAGTALPPQRVCMPFSLIVTSNDGGLNSILPGWLLASSPYTIARSEKKYATRRKATRHKHYTGWKIIRPETISMCRWARKQLVNAGIQSSKIYATDKAILGIGSNVVTEKGRVSGIKAYTDCIQRFALEGLLQWVLQTSESGAINAVSLQQEFSSSGADRFSCDIVTADEVEWPLFPWEATFSEEHLWNFQKAVLLEEFPLQGEVGIWISTLLKKLIDLEKDQAEKIYKCKKRDDQRGAQIIPGYASSHTPAETDAVIIEARKRADEIESLVKQCIPGIAKLHRSKL